MMFGGFLLTGLLIYGLVALVRREPHHAYHDGAYGGERDAYSRDNAVAILDERYARGEIGDEEYARRKAELRRR